MYSKEEASVAFCHQRTSLGVFAKDTFIKAVDALHSNNDFRYGLGSGVAAIVVMSLKIFNFVDSVPSNLCGVVGDASCSHLVLPLM